MAKKMLIDATHAEETRVVVVDGNKVEEFDFESENKRQLAGNIYLAKVTRVEPSLQAAFVDYGGNRHGFLAFSEIHPDYYQIPVADRQALMEEERAYAEAMRRRDEEEESKSSRRRSRKDSKAESAESEDGVTASEDVTDQIRGMETIDLDDDEDETPEGSSPMETVRETPVETPATDDAGDAEGAEEDESADEDGSSRRKRTSRSKKASAESDDEDENQSGSDASSKDDSIESVADDDDSEDIRPTRKPRQRRYKIQEVIKVRQILLVQVVKEERGNKGAALTTYLSLAGRYCVLMPNTARGGGISRKITNAADRKKLKEIANEIKVPTGAGLIVRTAGAKRTKAEIKRDYEYLQRLWEQIRELTLKSIAPAKIYEEGDLIKRSIRDLYNREIDEVFVEGDRGYKIAKDFMKMIMPSHAKNVKRYEDQLPLFARYQVESYLAGMFNPTVQLKSGGYIVIGVTEALVAIDVNSGRATKEGSIEETALKTNLEAAEEVARQLRLRDLAGLIVIDFIDMDERKNNAAVEKRLKDKLKTDRARIQVGRISGFGLLEMSRQRLRPGMLEASTQPCPACHGTGLIRSDDSMALNILRQIEEEGTRGRSREVLVTCPVGIANFLINSKREHIAQIEARYGMAVRVEGDPSLVSPDFSMEKFKTATRNVAAVEAPVISADATIMDDLDEDESDTDTDTDTGTQDSPEKSEDDTKPKRRRRRRRRRKSSGSGDSQSDDNGSNDDSGSDDDSDERAKSDDDARNSGTSEDRAEAIDDKAEPDSGEQKSKPKRSRRSRSSSKRSAPTEAETAGEGTSPEPGSEASGKTERLEQPQTPEVVVEEAASDERSVSGGPEPQSDTAEATPPVGEQAEHTAPEDPEEQPVASHQPDDVTSEATQTPEPTRTSEPEPVGANGGEDDKSSKPKRRGWWSLGSN
jgi:ribonuclease E